MLATLLGGLALREHVGFLIRAERTVGTVLSVETRDTQEGFTLYRPFLVFTMDGKEVRASAAETYRPTRAQEQLDVAYDPVAPDDVRLMDPRDRWLLPLWMAIFGLVTIVIAAMRWRRAWR